MAMAMISASLGKPSSATHHLGAHNVKAKEYGRYPYIGCFMDNDERLFDYHYGDHYTLDECAQGCKDHGYSYMGIQYTRTHAQPNSCPPAYALAVLAGLRPSTDRP